MSTAIYDTVLELVEQLTPEEQARLVKQLTEGANDGGHDDVEAALDDFDRFAERVSAAWQDDMSAAEAVKEQRREL